MPKQKKQPTTAHTKPAAKPVTAQPTQAEIARRAHEIYLARGGAAGSELDDWLQAERDLKAKGPGATPA